MADHRFPLQMEALALAVQSTKGGIEFARKDGEPMSYDDWTKVILHRASAFVGWAQGSTPSRVPNPNLRPNPKITQDFLGDPIEGPVR